MSGRRRRPAVRDRVVELRRVPARELIADERNWRRHPESQSTALRAMLADVGIADAVLARETDQGLVLIDGHLRKEILPDEVVPVLVLDVDEAEAGKLLATLDPLAAMAETDQKAFDALLEQMAIDDRELVSFLAKKRKEPTEPEPADPGPACTMCCPAHCPPIQEPD